MTDGWGRNAEETISRIVKEASTLNGRKMRDNLFGQAMVALMRATQKDYAIDQAVEIFLCNYELTMIKRRHAVQGRRHQEAARCETAAWTWFRAAEYLVGV